MAVSIELLDFYSALFERSCDAVNAMAAALNTFYNRRGFFLVNSNVGLGIIPLFVFTDIFDRERDTKSHFGEEWDTQLSGLMACESWSKSIPIAC